MRGQATGWILYGLLIGGLGLFAAVALANEAFAAGGAAIGAAVVLLACMVLLRRRTVAGAQRYAEWDGLKRFLKDFSQLQDAPSGHMALYERYLVAAVALGVADELVDALRVRIPEVANDPTFATWYVGSRTATGFGSFSSLGDFSSGLSSRDGVVLPAAVVLRARPAAAGAAGSPVAAVGVAAVAASAPADRATHEPSAGIDVDGDWRRRVGGCR